MNNAITKEQLLTVKPQIEDEFKKCPGCGAKLPLTNFEGNPDMPPSSLWLIEDQQLPARWVVVNGWICGNIVYGTAVLRGRDASKNEREPQLMVSHGHSYIIDLVGRKVSDY